MKLFKLTILFLAGFFSFKIADAQNVLMNILTQKSGLVKKGETVFLEITICNADVGDSVPVYTLRPQISVPSKLAAISKEGHVLPTGWTIISNNGSTLRLSNGRDMIASNECRTILIAVIGMNPGGPETISGNLLFSNGLAPGDAGGSALPGDNPADNISTSTCKVFN